jgi:hypothetical protein
MLMADARGLLPDRGGSAVVIGRIIGRSIVVGQVLKEAVDPVGGVICPASEEDIRPEA